MSTLPRTLRNLWKIGPRAYGHQMQYMGDTKNIVGHEVGKDKYGNTFYEDLENELPLRTRWVDYRDKEFDPTQMEPGWHAWMSYMTMDPPTKDVIAQTRVREWEPKRHMPNHTASRSAYRPYNTTKRKISAWMPKAESR